MKNVLGIDIGTNSIGAALVNLPDKFEDYGKEGSIEWMGSRIIPETNYSKAFEAGQKSSPKNMTPAGTRRQARGSRRLKHRYKLRRTRLIKVFKALGWLRDDFPLDESRKFKQHISENGYSLKISDYLPFSERTISEFEKELGIEGKKSKKKGNRKGGKSIVPEDWIVYYLRKKALFEEISIQELMRIIYVLNQRRGFKSSRKDLKETNVLPYEEFVKRKNNNDFNEAGIETQFVSITKIDSITFKEEKKDKKGNASNVYVIRAEDPRMDTWEETRKKEPEWKGKEFTFIVVQKIDKNGKFTQNKPQMPREDDWALCTTALSEKIEEKKQHPGEYFFDELKKAYLENRNYKIRQYPVYRWRYQHELEAIWNKQCELNPKLCKLNSDNVTLTKLAGILYPTQAKNNMPKLAEFQSHNLLHVISNDIIYYQRELRSQKNSISECRYEKRIGKGKNQNGDWIESGNFGLKCIPRSSPLFQEFRIWQDIHNIRILKREAKVDGKTKMDVDVSRLYVNGMVKEKLFDLFNSKASVSETDILTLIKDANEKSDVIIAKKGGEHSHKINLFSNRDSLKGNETLSRYRSVFRKVDFDGESVLNNKDGLMKLWHIDYSISSSDENKSEKGIMSALGWKKDNDTWLKTEKWELFKIPEKVAISISKLPELKKEYGSYSACAIKKLLPVMRCGKYWNDQDVSSAVNQRAGHISERLISINHNIKRLNEIADGDVQKQVLKSFIGKENLTIGLNTYQAGYLIYDKHSEKDKTPIKTVDGLSRYIQKEIPNNSLRNPVVEQVVKETMFLVRDVWNKYCRESGIDEIHIELGRNLKSNSAEREKIAESQTKNFIEKQRIKQLLYELINNGIEQHVDEDEINPFNFENGNFDWKTKIETSRFETKPNPESPADIDKFRVWRSLNKQSEFEWSKKVKDDKIPTEQEIKKYALWLSQNCRSPYTGKIIPLSKLFDISQYEIEHVIPRVKIKNDSFNNLVISEWGVNKAKDKNLAANFISESKGKCKYGDTEYKLLTYEEYEAYCKDTFKFQKGKLNNLLATEVPEGFIERQLNDTRYIGSKLAELLAPVAKDPNGIIFTGGSITSELKSNWGLNKVWKDIVRPRFERLEKITGNQYIIHEKDEHGNPVTHFNVKENQKLDIKRIDHRHHALDALIIAVTTREHIRYLNTLNAADTDDEIKRYKRSLVKGKIRDFKHPWEGFTKQAKDELERIIVSFKTNNKITSQPRNHTAYLNELQKIVFKEQKPNAKWIAVRKSMFKEPLGIIQLKEIKEVNVYDAFKVHIMKMTIESDKEKRRTASYVYDKQARKIIDDIIQKSGLSPDESETLLNEIEKYLKRNSRKIETDKTNKKGKPQSKTIYTLNGIDYDKIKIAHFVPYKTKRMALTKKDYVENLTIEKMKNDFPYFTFVHKDFFSSLSIEKKTIIKNANIDVSEHRKLNALNQLFLEHILEYGNNPKEAFGAEGLEKFNKRAIENPKIGKEIKSVTRKDGTVNLEDMFNGGFYETDQGSNVYFVMYENQITKDREGFKSIAAHKAIEKIVKGDRIVEQRDGFDTIILSPGDLVYVPTTEEREKVKGGIEITKAIDWANEKQITNRIYRVNDFSSTCYFTPNRIAKSILEKEADLNYDKQKNKITGSYDIKTASLDGVQIKEICIKLKVDRLGKIKSA